MIVIDASALLDFMLGQPNAPRIGRLIADPSIDLHAPHLLDLEVVQILRRHTRAGRLTADRATAHMRQLVALPIERHAHIDLLPRIWALRHGHSAYDAAYIALAEALPARLLTSDARLARTRGHRAEILVA